MAYDQSLYDFSLFDHVGASAVPILFMYVDLYLFFPCSDDHATDRKILYTAGNNEHPFRGCSALYCVSPGALVPAVSLGSLRPGTSVVLFTPDADAN